MKLEFKGPLMVNPDLVLFFELKERELFDNIKKTYVLDKDNDFEEKFIVEEGDFLNPKTFRKIPSFIVKKTSKCTEEDVAYLKGLYEVEKKKYIVKIKNQLSEVPLSVKVEQNNDIVVYVEEEYFEKVNEVPYLDYSDKDLYVIRLSSILQDHITPLNNAFKGKTLTEDNINSYKSYLELEYNNNMLNKIRELIDTTIDYKVAVS